MVNVLVSNILYISIKYSLLFTSEHSYSHYLDCCERYVQLQRCVITSYACYYAMRLREDINISCCYCTLEHAQLRQYSTGKKLQWRLVSADKTIRLQEDSSAYAQENSTSNCLIHMCKRNSIFPNVNTITACNLNETTKIRLV